jgi:hypothetical protein
MSATSALNYAISRKLGNVLILSESADGELIFITTSELDLAGCNWLCDRMKAILLTPADDLEEE